MAAGWSVLLERDMPDAPEAGAGKSLLYYQRQIDELAARLGLTPLSRFFSRDPRAILAYLREQGVEPDPQALPDEEWFNANDGQATVTGLLAHLKQRPGDVPEPEKIVADLEEVERALQFAGYNDLRFHLGRELPKHETE